MANGYYYLALGLGLFAAAMGFIKIAPIEPGHGMQTSLMNRFAGVFPLRAVGFNPSGEMYCAVFAFIEIFFGALLAFGRGDWPFLGCIFLLTLAILAVHGHLAIGSAPADILLPGIILALLVLLLFGRGGYWGGYGKLHLA